MRKRANIDGLTPRERSVCALWDKGMSIETIAAHLRLERSKVSSIVSYLNENDEGRRDRVAMAKGSKALAAAIKALA